MIRFAMMPLLFVLCACQHDTAPMQPDSTTQPELPASTGNAADAPANDAAFVLPGDFSQGTSVADLEARFGKANVKITSQPGEDGFYHRVVLFPEDPTRRAFVDFYEDQPLSGVHSISVRDAGSRWRGKLGVHIGMSLAELQGLNAKPFLFYGFDSQQRGWAHDGWSPVLDDNDNQLGKLDVQDEDHMYFGVGLGLRDPGLAVPAGTLPSDENSVHSDDPRYPKLGELVVVTEINASTSLDDEWD